MKLDHKDYDTINTVISKSLLFITLKHMTSCFSKSKNLDPSKVSHMTITSIDNALSK